MTVAELLDCLKQVKNKSKEIQLDDNAELIQVIEETHNVILSANFSE